MSLYTSLVDRVLWPLWETGLRKRPTPELLADLRRSESAPIEAIRDEQISALRGLVAHAAKACPHYQRSLAKVEAGRLSFDSLRELPILTRADAQASVAERRASGPFAPTIRKTTGGTTGEPLVIEYDARSEHWRQAVKLRGFGWAGYRVGAPSVHYWGAPRAEKSRGAVLKETADRFLKRETWLDSNAQDDDSKRVAAATLADRKPRFLFAYSQAAADLARFVNQNRLRRWPEIRVIGGAEKIYPDDRAEMEAAFGEVFETYGCREVMLIATECEVHEGLHLSMENLIVEILDGDGSPTEPGEVGRVVMTDLHNYGAPLIRYANGDLAIAMDPSQVCRCGRPHPRLQSIEGRSTETLRAKDGSAVGGMMFNLIFSPLAEHVRQFQVHQVESGAITVRVVPAGGVLADSVRRELLTKAERYLAGVPIDVEIVDDIPLSKSGKKRVVIVD